MTPTACLTLSALAFLSLPVTALAIPPMEDLDLEAPYLEIELQTRALLATQGFKLRHEGFFLQGQWARLDTKGFHASGQVELRMGSMVMEAQEMRLRLPGPRGEARKMRLVLERGGRALEMGAQASSFDGASRVEMRGVWATTCQCPPGCRLPLAITAKRARLDLEGQELRLERPVLRFYDIPLLALPRLWLPLGRRSGFLAPHLALLGTRVRLGVPLLFTLGDRADLIIKGSGTTGQGAGVEGRVRGLSGSGPWEGGIYYGMDDGLDKGHRLALDGMVNLAFSERLALRGRVRLLGDGAIPLDHGESVMERWPGAVLSRLALLVQTREILAAGIAIEAAQGVGEGTGLDQLRGLQPSILGLPVVWANMVVPLSRSLDLTGHLDAEWWVETGPGARSPVLRPQASLGLRMPLVWAPYLEFMPALRYLHQAQFPLAGEPLQRGMAVLSARASTRLSRAYGELVHSLEPEVAWLWIPQRWDRGAGSWEVLDDRDLLGPVHHLMVGGETALAGGGWSAGLRAMQLVEMAPGALGPLLLRARVGYAPLQAQAALGLNPWQGGGVLTDMVGSLVAGDVGATGLALSYVHLTALPSASSLMVPEDPFVNEGPPWPAVGSGAKEISLLGGLALGPWYRLTAEARLDVDGLGLVEAGAALHYRSPCRCLGASLAVRVHHDRLWPADLFFTLNLQ